MPNIIYKTRHKTSVTLNLICIKCGNLLQGTSEEPIMSEDAWSKAKQTVKITPCNHCIKAEIGDTRELVTAVTKILGEENV